MNFFVLFVFLAFCLSSQVLGKKKKSHTHDNFPNSRVVNLLGKGRPPGRIRHGRLVKDGDYPFQASVWNFLQDSHVCGGVLLNAAWVLTSASCIDGASEWNVTIGTIFRQYRDWSTNKLDHHQTQKTTTYFIHPYYLPTRLYNNIGLLQMKKNFDLNAFVGTIRLPRRSALANPLIKVEIRVIGWGEDERRDAAELNFADVLTLSNPECRKKYYNDIKNPFVIDTVLCAEPENNTQTVCFGDIGGAAVRKEPDGIYTLIGIIRPVEICHPQSSNSPRQIIMDRAAYYIDWISRKIGISIRP